MDPRQRRRGSANDGAVVVDLRSGARDRWHILCSTRRMVRVLVLGLVIGMIGCAGEGDPREACKLGGGLMITGAPFGGLDYQILGGLSGDGDGTKLQILPDGAFARCTYQRGMEQGQLDRTALDDVMAKARDAQFPTLSVTYPCSGCVDDFVYQVSVQFDGSVLSSRASELGNPPDRLRALIDALQQIVDRPLS